MGGVAEEFDADEFEQRQAAETIAGERCPCGHHRRSHDPPDPAYEDSEVGPCKVLTCECKGVIDATGDRDEIGIEAYE